MLTEKQMVNDLKKLGLCEGDSVIIHSSFKSLGEVEGGAETVVNAFRKAVGESGTVIFPTLCKDDWEHIYENWNLDAPSFVGYLTNYFRKLPGAFRSNQATHSVAAMGKDAEYITKTHGESGLRYGMYGDTPFAADSPWEKMYKMNTKIVFLGVSSIKCTFRHYVEYCFIDECLKLMEGKPYYEKMKSEVWSYDEWEKQGVWPGVNNEYMEKKLREEGKVSDVTCGDAHVIMFSSKDFVDKALELLKKREPEVLLCAADAELLKTRFEWFEKTGIYDE